jgi:hypothetical protein
VYAADRTWQAAGDGDWSEPANWSGGVPPGASDTAVFNNALSGDVTINMDAQAQPVAALRLQNATAPWRRAFTGALAAGQVFQAAGDAALAGTWQISTAEISYLGNGAGELARLEIGAGGRLLLTNGASVYLGDTDGTRGQLFVRNGAEVVFHSPAAVACGLYIARNSGSAGAVVQTGGSVRKNTAMIVGYGGHGAYELHGGELYHPYGNSQSRWRIGMNGPGLFYLRGGRYTACSAATGETFEIGRNNAASHVIRGVLFCDGGEALIDHHVKFLHMNSGSSANCYAELTVAGGGAVNCREVRVGYDGNSRGRGVVNLNGRGVLSAYRALKPANAQNAAVVNFDGGTFAMATTGDEALFTSLTDAIVYGGGARLASSTGRAVLRRDSKLRRARGQGVDAITLMDGGAGFMAPPVVTFAGGGGSNATAVAFIDYASGAVTGVVVTCRGEGYASASEVAFTGGGGGGASATAQLAENVAGALAFMGPNDSVIHRLETFDGEVQACGGTVYLSSRTDEEPGMPLIPALRLNGGKFQVGSSGAETDCPYDDMLNPAAALVFGGERGGGEYRQPRGPVDNPHIQNFSAVRVNAGRGLITTTADSVGAGRTAEVVAGAFDRETGGLLFLGVNALTGMTVKFEGAPVFGGGVPVMAGVYAGASGLVTVSPEGAWQELAAYDDDDFGADKNYRMTESGLALAPSSLTVNSMSLLDGAALTLSDAGATVVESGMVTVGDGSAGAVIGGGPLTSGNGRDLIVYDAHTGFERRNTAANNTSLWIDARITDNGAAPVALVATGPANVSSMLLASGGVTTLAQPTNDYSGGTYIIDAALEAAEDRSLGAVPDAPSTNIVTSGMAIIRANRNAWPLVLHENRGICLKGGCLTLIGDDNNQTGKTIMSVNGPVSGHGALVLNHWAGGGVGSVIELNGDNNAFEGTYVVHGILRAGEGTGLSRLANLALCDNNDSGVGTRASGIVEMSGVMNRAPGTGAGQVQWCRANDIYPNLVGANDPAYSGGFSAYGGPLTVNLGGDRRTLTLGQNGFNPTVLRLQTDAATHDLFWENPVEVAGAKNIAIQVARNATDKQVFWSGAISNSSATVRNITIRQNGKLILCDGADVGGNLIVVINSSLQCAVTNRQTLACDFRGSGPLTKRGAGATFATGVSTNTGAMRIYEGAWYANGQHTLAGHYTVSNSAVLGGAGVVAPASGNGVAVDGTLAPGAEAGACGTLTLGSAEQATVLTLNGTLELDVAEEACDRVDVFGDVTFGEGATVSVTALDETVWQTRRGEDIPVLTWTGAWNGGVPEAAPALPQGWKLRLNAAEKTVYLSYASSGTIIRVL